MPFIVDISVLESLNMYFNIHIKYNHSDAEIAYIWYINNVYNFKNHIKNPMKYIEENEFEWRW